jgi:hypothetical protein
VWSIPPLSSQAFCVAYRNEAKQVSPTDYLNDWCFDFIAMKNVSDRDKFNKSI